MIWIKNHGISGESDNLRIPIRNSNVPVVTYNDEGDTTTVVKLQRWTGLDIDTDLPDQAIENGFLDGLGDQVRFAYKEDADHADYNNKAEELDAYYDGTHPETS